MRFKFQYFFNKMKEVLEFEFCFLPKNKTNPPLQKKRENGEV